MRLLVFLFMLLPFVGLSQPVDYGYPMNGDHKVTYKEKVKVGGANKNQLYKRALQFVALQNFERSTEIRTKTKGYYSGQLVDKAITYQDAEDGKVFGNGFFPFEYRDKKYFTLNFTYKIYLTDNGYEYVFSDFTVKEFIHLGKSTSHGSFNPMIKGASKDIGSDIRTYSLERFTEFKAYDRSDPMFKKIIEKLKQDLSVAMSGKA